MYSECVNEFIDWVSTEFWESNYTASQIVNFYQTDRSGIKEYQELSGGCTNSSVKIEFYDNTKIKMSVYNKEISPYKINNFDSFLEERVLKNSLYKEEFRIIYNADSCIVISEYIEGAGLDSILSASVKNHNIDRICNLNSKVINSISKFHNYRLKTHRTTLTSIAMTFFAALKEKLILYKDRILDSDLKNVAYIGNIAEGINKILLFESKFPDSDFVLSHLDTDPVNLLFNYKLNNIRMIDFEFAGVGLKYYDYANYLNVLDSLHTNEKLSDSEKSKILEEFLKSCRKYISDFNVHDFQKSYLIMRFTWGIWYIMYGVENNLDDYIKIGKNWINDWINEKDVL